MEQAPDWYRANEGKCPTCGFEAGSCYEATWHGSGPCNTKEPIMKMLLRPPGLSMSSEPPSIVARWLGAAETDGNDG